jgi:8-oxo-dGTP pyrophosphatase MutT (NUDIX family)
MPDRFTHARVLCLDGGGRLLLMKWRDPFDGHDTWEPPGGGIEEGETPRQAAARELREEAGIVAEVSEAYVRVPRDDWWKGKRRDREEPFFVAEAGDAAVVPDMPTADETDTLVEWRYVAPDDVALLDAPVWPEDPFAVLARLRAVLAG